MKCEKQNSGGILEGGAFAVLREKFPTVKPL